jgi:hypothetical protein
VLRLASLGALLALASGVVGAPAASGEHRARQHEVIDFGARRAAHLYAPARAPNSAPARAPLTLMLHGMCALPEYECPVFEPGTREHFLLCPPGPAACAGAGAMWTGRSDKLVERLNQAVGAAEERHPGALDPERRAIIGYSMGASAALRIVLAEPRRFQALMILNAGVAPSASDLRRSGPMRVALVSGDRDRSAGKLKRKAASLSKAGFDVRYFALEKTGHYFDAETARKLTEPLRWLTAAPSRGSGEPEKRERLK